MTTRTATAAAATDTEDDMSSLQRLFHERKPAVSISDAVAKGYRLRITHVLRALLCADAGAMEDNIASLADDVNPLSNDHVQQFHRAMRLLDRLVVANAAQCGSNDDNDDEDDYVTNHEEDGTLGGVQSPSAATTTVIKSAYQLKHLAEHLVATELRFPLHHPDTYTSMPLMLVAMLDKEMIPLDAYAHRFRANDRRFVDCGVVFTRQSIEAVLSRISSEKQLDESHTR